MASADGLVLPKPAVPKTLGILNVIFAVLLLLGGLCLSGVVLLQPLIQEFGQKLVAQANAGAEARKAAELKALDDRAGAATTDEEKAAIAEERAAVAARPAPVSFQVNPGADMLQDATYKAYLIVTLALSLIFNVALLVAGIGLIRLTPWGRTLALWWAGLVIAKLVILAGVHFALIRPMERGVADANIAKLRADAARPGAPPQAEVAARFAEVFAQLGPVFAAAGLLISIAYPVTCLVLLNTEGARAACLRRPSVGPEPGGALA